MDKQTLSYYSRNAGEIFSRVDSMEGESVVILRRRFLKKESF